jgi:hypothetical protein
MMNVECLQDCLQIVERVVEFGGGKMPADRAALVALLTNKFARPEFLAPDMRARLSLAEWEESKACFAAALEQALDIFERDRRGMYLN